MRKMGYAVAAMAVLLIALVYGSLFLTAAGGRDREGWIDYIERVCEERQICPELVEALIETESSWDPYAMNGTCIGLMQIDKVYHRERMQKLGVTDLTDPYENILVGVDFLEELFWEYEDPAAVLMYYNAGHSDRYGLGAWQGGSLSKYAERTWRDPQNWSAPMGNKTEEKASMADLSEARKNAWSFPGLIPPPGAKEIGREKRGEDEVIYYADGKGNYWFNTKSQIALEMELQAAMNKRKRKNRRR